MLAGGRPHPWLRAVSFIEIHQVPRWTKGGSGCGGGSARTPGAPTSPPQARGVIVSSSFCFGTKVTDVAAASLLGSEAPEA